jgi:NADH-quinone oxidoreductase subunit L
MTRLMKMTFAGEERFRKTHHDGHDADDGHDSHHGPVEPHESPPSMTVPLIVLAVCSLVAGWVGIPHFLSAGANLNKFEHWLEPTIADVTREVPPGAAGAHAAGEAAHAASSGAGEHASDTMMEWILMGLSVGIAFAGIWLGRLFYEKNPKLPVQWAERLKPLYKLSFNKWYWDWLLDVKGVEAGKAANNALWKVDATVVDGGVNGSAWLTRLWARISGWWDKWIIDAAVNLTGFISYFGSLALRAIQTGLWQNYAMFFAIGLFLILIYYVYPALIATIRGFGAK